jgi:beta propeller repeat protein
MVCSPPLRPRLALWVLGLAALLVLVFGAVAQAAVTQVTYDGYVDAGPAVSGGRVVWMSGGNYMNIVMYDSATRTTTWITDNAYNDMYPQMDENYVVWESHDGSDWEIFLYEISTGTTRRLTNNVYEDSSPIVHQGQVVWLGLDGSDWEVFFYDATTRASRKITNNAYDDSGHSIHQGQIVWHGGDGQDDEIFLYHSASGATTQLTNNETSDMYPHIHAGRVVWEGRAGDWADIFFYDPVTKNTTNLSNTPQVWERAARIDGGQVVWYSQTHRQNYLYEFATGAIKTLKGDGQDWFPQIDRGIVVWQTQHVTGGAVFIHDSASGLTKKISDTLYSYGPRVDRGQVVWSGHNTGNSEIFLYTPDRTQLPAGWNLIAGAPGSDLLGATLFGYNGSGYRSTTGENMEAGEGYWVRLPQSASVALNNIAAPFSVGLRAGWNLVGNANVTRTTLPQGMVAFVYEGGRYQSRSYLDPGQGAWIRMNYPWYLQLGAN